MDERLTKTKYSCSHQNKVGVIEVRFYIIKKFGKYMIAVINKNSDDHPSIIQNHPDFVRWIDDDWVGVEI